MRRVLVVCLLILAVPLAGCAPESVETGVRIEAPRIEYTLPDGLWVEQGGMLDIDARVVSAATGEPLPGIDVAGTATGGALTARDGRGGAGFRFQADRDIPPPYVITLTAHSAGGSDTVTLRVEAGWRFTDAGFRSSLEGNLPEIGESWSGRVCGEPFGEWSIDRVVTETDVQNRESFSVVPAAVDDRGDRQFGGVLMIAVNPGERHGDAPFLLFLDDVEPPEFVPAAQRIPVAVEPLSAEECR